MAEGLDKNGFDAKGEILVNHTLERDGMDCFFVRAVKWIKMVRGTKCSLFGQS